MKTNCENRALHPGEQLSLTKSVFVCVHSVVSLLRSNSTAEFRFESHRQRCEARKRLPAKGIEGEVKRVKATGPSGLSCGNACWRATASVKAFNRWAVVADQLSSIFHAAAVGLGLRDQNFFSRQKLGDGFAHVVARGARVAFG